ncbi:MAG: hypothetical protein R2698_02890 [Microthrixaceae bacterium]
MRSNATTRPVVAVLVAAVLGLAGCGSGSEAKPKAKGAATTTTSKKQGDPGVTTLPGGPTPQTAATPTTLTFKKGFPRALAALKAVPDGDFCAAAKSMAAANGITQPTDPEGVKNEVEYFQLLFDKLASGAPEAVKAEAKALQDAATQFADDAKAVDYAVSALGGNSGPKAFNNDATNQAFDKLSDEMAKCGPLDSAPPTTGD